MPGAAREGLHSMVAGGNGTVFAVWLDLRGNGTQLYGAVSHDSGATWSKNVSVYASPSGSICQCCHPTAVVDVKGGITVMFRNSLDGSRDLFAVTSTDGGKAFGPSMKFGKGSWQIDACPMDGGGLIAAHDGKLISVWRRQKEVFIAPLGGEEELLGTGKDPALAEGSHGVYVIWTSPAGLQARIPGRPGLYCWIRTGRTDNSLRCQTVPYWLPGKARARL